MTRTHWVLVLGGLTLLVGAAWLFIAGPLRPVGGEPTDRAAQLRPGPALLVETSYPGASAPVIADTVATLLEHEIAGVENMRSLVSRCSGDGRYTLTLTLEPGTDLHIAQVLVQNRVALAHPHLPERSRRPASRSGRKRPVCSCC